MKEKIEKRIEELKKNAEQTLANFHAMHGAIGELERIIKDNYSDFNMKDDKKTT